VTLFKSLARWRESPTPPESQGPVLQKSLNLFGRILLAQIFVVSGFGKIVGYAYTQTYMVSKGVPGEFLTAVILLEIGGGIAIVLGFLTRWIALVLATFCVAAGLIFYFDPHDPMKMIMLMKDFAIAGGFLLLAQVGALSPSIDGAPTDTTAAD
jgi:putative oxidoreductase